MFPVVVGLDDGTAAREGQRTVSAELAASNELGFSLFPGEVAPLPIIREADREAISECSFGIGDVGDDFVEELVVMCLAGVVTYRFATSGSTHTTRFAFYVGGDERGKDRTVLYVGRMVPQDEIVFLKEYAASYAD